MEVEDALRALGGTARWRTLRGHVGWRAIKRARASGAVEFRDGCYHLVGTEAARISALRLRAVASHTTAAEHWGLALPPEDPPRAHLTVPANAHRRGVPSDVQLHYRDLDRCDIDGEVTTPLRTVLDCLRDEPLRVALSVGDSALADGRVGSGQLERAVMALRGPGSALARERLLLLDARSANAFESCCRAILIEAGVTGFELQVNIRHRGQWVGRVDLADRQRRIVIECDGFGAHGGREMFVKDLVRSTLLVAGGWRPLRFTWEQVMFEPQWVLDRVQDVIAGSPGAVKEEERRQHPGRKAA